MQAREQDSQENDRDSGTNSRESFASFDPVSSSWRTSQRCLVEGWTPYSEPWPRSGMTLNGRAYERPTWAQGIGESGCSSLRGESKMGIDSWATPTASDGLAETLSPGMVQRDRGPQNLAECVSKATWMTPTTRDWKGGACAESDVPTNGLLGRQAVRAWPTPNAKECGPKTNTKGPTQIGLRGAIERLNWPTPDAAVSNDTEELASWLARRERVKATAQNGNGMGTPLAVAVRMPDAWSTPTASDSIDDGARWSETQRTTTSDVLAPTGVRDPSTRGMKLNPAWVEQLMGFPPGWTLLAPASPSTTGKRRASSRKRKIAPCASEPSGTPSFRKSRK